LRYRIPKTPRSFQRKTESDSLYKINIIGAPEEIEQDMAEKIVTMSDIKPGL